MCLNIIRATCRPWALDIHYENSSCWLCHPCIYFHCEDQTTNLSQYLWKSLKIVTPKSLK